jgi:hypothetical protein
METRDAILLICLVFGCGDDSVNPVPVDAASDATDAPRDAGVDGVVTDAPSE